MNRRASAFIKGVVGYLQSPQDRDLDAITETLDRATEYIRGLHQRIEELQRQRETAQRIHEADERLIAWYRIRLDACRRNCRRHCQAPAQTGASGDQAA